MKKSLYSLILSDGVVSEIDRLAYKANTNRSNMINQILAEYVSYTTPEKRMEQIFERLMNVLAPSETFQTLMGNSLSVLNLRSSLDFKYNPSVKYSIELYRAKQGEIGHLKVSLRTQNPTLTLYMMQFYKLWAKTESAYIKDTEYEIDCDKFIRKLKPSATKEISTEKLGELIAEYIKAFDRAMKAFFYNININETENAIYNVEKIYREYLQNCETGI